MKYGQMAKRNRALRAVDLYSGVGGWSLGLKMAGIDVVASYDIWNPANETNSKNNGHPTFTVDLRKLNLSELPSEIDIVVGSPPCTQFSYANRGGGGNIEDGLADIELFLRVVDRLRPTAWAMENVPRLAAILDRELQPDGRLAEFSHLQLKHRIINMEAFGLPQRRRRCIAGNFDFDLLQAYTPTLERRTLGQVIDAFQHKEPVDPIYGITLPSGPLVDHVTEDGLSNEEMRINRANKVHHPIYNRMPFPDPLDRSVRTITATCTRVSRESIVVSDPADAGIHRRLTIRERASLQGFPINFQFFGKSYSQKIKMIGNAVPPLFSYYVAKALQGVPLGQIGQPDVAKITINPAALVPRDTPPAGIGAIYPRRRTFRFAIPSLRLSSGVRFDLTNASGGQTPEWRVDFVFGTSKSIHKLEPGSHLLEHLRPLLGRMTSVKSEIKALEELVSAFDVVNLQRVWNHTSRETHHPFQLLDALDVAGRKFSLLLASHEGVAEAMVINSVVLQHHDKVIELKGVERLTRNASVIASGLLVGSVVNAVFSNTGIGRSASISGIRFVS